MLVFFFGLTAVYFEAFRGCERVTKSDEDVFQSDMENLLEQEILFVFFCFFPSNQQLFSQSP